MRKSPEIDSQLKLAKRVLTDGCVCEFAPAATELATWLDHEGMREDAILVRFLVNCSACQAANALQQHWEHQ